MNMWAAVDLAVLVYWVAVAVLIISQDREPSITLAWLLVLFALPFVGLPIYFFFGRDWPHIVQKAPATQRLKGIVGRFMPQVYAPYVARGEEFLAAYDRPQLGKIAALIERKADTPVLPARTCDLYESGEEYFDVLIADLREAKRFVHMNYFIWGNDELTRRIVDALLDRVRDGVEVRILNDYLGSAPHSKSQLDELSAAGAIVGSDISGLARINYRNHRKLTVVDGEIGHTGGFNIKQEYIDGGERFPAWRDTGMRITGPAVADLEKLFDMRWYEVYGEDLFKPEYYPDPSLPHGDIVVQTVHQGYDDRWNAATRAYQLAMTGARDHILLQSPYFVPDPTTLDILINAAASGVRVDFMTTSWLDKKVPWWSAESYFEPLLAAGARVWLWEKGFFHAKSLSVDGKVCSIGSLNLDIRSLRINKELMVWVYNDAVAARSEAIFAHDLEECRELTLEEVRGWPLARKFRNSSARLLSHLL